MNVSPYVRRAGAVLALGASGLLAQTAPPMQVGGSVWVRFFASGGVDETQVARGTAKWLKCGPKTIYSKYYSGPDTAHLTLIGGDSLLIPVPCGSIILAPRPLVGAIRWDLWQPGGTIGNLSIAMLGPSKWRYRLPWYATQISDTTVAMNENTQAIMDQEIAYAHSAGLNYWAFNYGWGEMEQSLGLYLSSAHKGDINFCLMVSAIQIDRVVSLIKTEPTYQKVAGGRPLIYLQTWYFEGNNIARSSVDSLRAKIIAAGFPNPYLVAENFDPVSVVSDATVYGLDAIAGYGIGVGPGHGESAPYSELVSNAQSMWDSFAATGRQVIPSVMTGWNPHPLWDFPTHPFYEANPSSKAYANATPQAFGAHFKAAVDWVAAHPASAGEANAILIYAWNEIDEGGWLLPSNPTFNPVGSGRLDAIAAVLRPSSASAAQRKGIPVKKP